MDIRGNPVSRAESNNLFAQSFPIPKQCEDMLSDLHSSISKLDASFKFAWDAELTLIFTTKYLKQAADKISSEKEKVSSGQSSRNSESLDHSLRAKEQELIERENRLQSYTASLKDQEKRLSEIQKETEIATSRNAQEKKTIEESFQRLIEEKNRINSQMKKLEDKYSEIKNLLVEIDTKKAADLSTENLSDKDLALRYQDFERQKLEFDKEKEVQISQFLKIEASLKDRDANLEQKKESLQQLANSLQKLKKELTQHHEKVSEQMDSQFAQLQDQEKELKEKKAEMDETLAKLNEELAEVEALKRSLEAGQRLDLSSISDASLQEKVKNLVERENKVEVLNEKLKEKEKQLEERAKYFDSVENLKDELERVQKLYQEMETDYESREIQAAAKSNNLEMREKAILAIENSDSSGLVEINNEIKENLKKMQEDEEKILKAQEFVLREKEELDKSTKMLQGIFQELSTQRKKLMEDQLNLELEKEKFVEVVGKLEEESRNISDSEEIISSKLLELQKKELELEEKELELLQREKALLESENT